VLPLLRLPMRLYTSATLRSLRDPEVRAQFAWRKSANAPPPVVTALMQELQLGEILNAVYLLAGTVVGIAFLFVGSSIFIGGLGHFGGAGATLSWAAHP